MNTSPASPHWLDLFCSRLACTPEFFHALSAQLGSQFESLTGAPIAGWVLAPPRDAADIRFDTHGIATLDTDLVLLADGLPVTIAWRRAGHPRPMPSDIEAAGAAGGLQAWWVDLPIAEVRALRTPPDGPPWTASADFPFDAASYGFAVDWERFAWPDVWLRIDLAAADAARTSAVRKAVVPVLEAARERWNQARDPAPDPARGVIHQLGGPAGATAVGSVHVHIDFGSAGPKALVAMLDALNALETTAVPLRLRRVVVGSAP